MSAWLVAGLLVAAIVAAVLAAPLTLMLRVARTERVSGAWQVSWLYGAVRMRGVMPRARRREPHPPRTPRRTRPGRGWKRLRAVMRTPGLALRLRRLARELLRQLAWGDLAVRLEYGFDDPADTGRLYGVLAPVCLAADARGWPVTITPRFDRAGVTGDGQASLTLRPIGVIAVLVRFALSRPALRAAHAAWRG